MIRELDIPASNIKILEGTVVTLAYYPGTTWVVRYGWYVYENQRYYGWYFSSIPEDTVVPASEEYLLSCKVVSGSADTRYCPPPAPGPKPPHPAPGPMPPCADNVRIADSAFISVQTLKDRDMLNMRGIYIPNGKLIRVNDVDGEAKYYVWNSTTLRWHDVVFPGDVDVISDQDIDDMIQDNPHTPSDNKFLNQFGLEYFYSKIATSFGYADCRTTEEWSTQTTMMSTKGALYVYTDHLFDSHGDPIPGIKVGDGTSYVVDLPFTDLAAIEHIANLDIHVSSTEREAWNSSVSVKVSTTNPENLVFYNVQGGE